MKKNLLLGLILSGIIALGYKIFYTESQIPLENYPVSNLTAELNKKIKSRDLMGQFQKFSETFQIYKSWTPQQQQIYREQYKISEDFIQKTEAYFKELEPK